MAEVASAYVSLLPSARGFGSKLESQVGGEVSSSGKNLGSKFGTVFKVGAAAALGGAAVLAGFLKGSLDEAREAQKVTAQTNAVIKSTGGIAGVTAKQVGDLASAISRKSGIDDEAIQSGENLLLTFTNIRNEAGKGNDVFNQATQIVTDMSVALGTDMKGSAIQVGKALNDPIKGVTALTRVGVSFTEQQKAQIKAMVESGNELGAQKLILGELNKEFGGSAAAAATAGDKFKVAFGNLQEAVGTALLPLVDRLLVGLTAVVNVIAANVAPAIARLSSLFSGGGGGGGFVGGLQAAGDVLRSNFMPVLEAWATTMSTVVVPAVVRLGSYLASTLGPMLQRIGQVIATQVLPIVSSLAQFFYGRLIPAVVQIVTVIAQKLRPAFEQYVATIQNQVLPAIQRLLAKFREYQPAIQAAVVAVVKIIGKVLEFAAAILGKVLPVVIRIQGFMAGAWVTGFVVAISAVGKIIASVVRFAQAIGDVIGKVRDFVSAVRDSFGQAASAVTSAAGRIAAALSPVIAAFDAVIDTVNALISAIKSIPTPHIKVPNIDVPGFARGTSFAPGGMAIVGERGPELVNLPRGSQVIPNHRAFGGSGRDGAVTVHLSPETLREMRRLGFETTREFGEVINGAATSGHRGRVA